MPHMNVVFDLMLIHMKYQDFSFREFSLPMIPNILMLKIKKQSTWINSQTFLGIDDHDHFLKQL